MANKHWNLIVVAAFLLGGLFVVAFNYFIDPYEVFEHHYLRSGYAVNERYRKVEHLLHARWQPDSYIMGSSVMGVYDPEFASRTSGRRYYNLSFLAGTPKDALGALKVLKMKGQPIKEMLFGVDFFTFYEHPKGDTPMARPHPLVSGESMTSFYGSYLFSPGLWQGGTRIAHHLQDAPSIYFDVDHTGMYRLYDYDRRIAADHDLYIRQMFAPNKWSDAEVVWLDERFNEFEELCRWLDEQGIKARFFIHPFYQATLATVSPKSYAKFTARLRTIKPDIVDFSGVSSVTTDPHWYYDKRHYRPVVATRIMGIMYSQQPKAQQLEVLKP